MKSIQFLLFLFLLIQSPQTGIAQTSSFECKISTSKKVYTLGEIPEIRVEITNNSEEVVYLLYSLDGSESSMRYPYCKMDIKKPNLDTLKRITRCGFTNPLKANDFVLVEPGASFNPYKYYGQIGYASAHGLPGTATFQEAGIYSFTFYYSTISENIADYFGFGQKDADLNELYSKVPKVSLQSNTLEIEIVEN